MMPFRFHLFVRIALSRESSPAVYISVSICSQNAQSSRWPPRTHKNQSMQEGVEVGYVERGKSKWDGESEIIGQKNNSMIARWGISEGI